MKLQIGILLGALCTLTGCAGADNAAWSSANPQRFSKISLKNAVWVEDFSSRKADFTVQYLEGAKGQVEIIPQGGRDNSPALRIVKSNDSGYILIKFNRQLAVKKNDKLQINAFYRTIKRETQNSLALLRLQVPGQTDYRVFCFYPGCYGGNRLQEVLGTPRDTWERKLTQRKATAKDRYFEPTLVVLGGASETIWDNFYAEDDNISAANWDRTLNRREPIDRTPNMISLNAIDQRLKTEKDHTGEVVSINGKSRLLIDGKLAAPVINGPYSASKKGKCFSNAKEFGEIGVHIVKVSIRLGQGKVSHPGVWKGKDDLDLQGAVNTFRNAIRLDPEARVILSIMLHPYWNFTQDFPAETWINGKGYQVYGSGIHLSESIRKSFNNPRRYTWPSYQSQVLNDLYKVQIKKIIAELKRTGLSKLIVGVHIGGGHDNQLALAHFDYSAPAVRNFRKYLQKKYGTDQALQAAWNNSKVTLATANAPKFDHSRDFFDPQRDQAKIDFYQYSKFAPWHIGSEMAELCRRELGKKVFTMRWCMAPYSGAPANTLDVDDFLRNQKFDILVAQASYNQRPPASPCLPRLPLDSFHLHNKLYVNEFDLRTWNAAPSWEKEIMSIGWGLVLDPPMWRASHRKLVGSMLANDMGYWYLDMAPGWFDHPEIMEDIKASLEQHRKIIARKPSTWRKDTAFVVDNMGMFLYNLPAPAWKFDMTELVAEQAGLLGLSGVPYSFLSLQDLLERPELAKQFKVLVFGAMFNIDEPRQKLLESLKNSGRTLIFLSGTGIIQGAGQASPFEIFATKRVRNHNVIAAPGVTDSMKSHWMTALSRAFKRKAQWYEFITIHYTQAEPTDRVLARFELNNQPAVVERQFPNWKAVYIGEAGGLSPGYFNRLVREAGGYCTAPADFQCETNGNFLAIHCMNSGPVTFKFPYRGNVTNLCNGKKYRNISELKTNAEAGSTYWFELKK